MKKIFSLLLTLVLVLFMYSSPVSAAYYGKFSSLLGKDYDMLFQTYFIFAQNNPNIVYRTSTDSNGYDEIYCFYYNNDIKTLETLTFNDEGMSVRYTVLQQFNDYNELINAVKKEDEFLHSIGTVIYDAQGTAHTSDWEYQYAYYAKDYGLLIAKQYTPRGEYKASLRFIDDKFDRIERSIY